MRLKYLLLLACFIHLHFFTFSEISREQKKKIKKSCFEIVTNKEKKDSLTYEKELPWDKVDFQYRTDQYESIGTAFSVSQTELITAYHVLDLGVQHKIKQDYYIRDRENNVYPIDRILQFDCARDFVKFTVKGKKFKNWLATVDQYEVDDLVYSVGNAYGEGIVIREGELIAEKPESEKGEWKILKSSSDVNRGNSGGPLLNSKGEVIGVITHKKDNISYSLPYAEIIKAKKDQGSYHRKFSYLFDLMTHRFSKDLDYEIKLPQSYQEVKKISWQKRFKEYTSCMDQLFSQYQDKTFPRGDSSLIALYDSIFNFNPTLLYEKEDSKNWVVYNTSEMQETNLNDNATLGYTGDYNQFIGLGIIKKPQSITIKDFYRNPKLIMDKFLEGHFSHRELGGEKIRITSLGEPYAVTDYQDRYGRNWMISKWLIEFCDSCFILFSTVTPQGVIFLIKNTASYNDAIWTYDLKKVVDFSYFTYYGKIKEWEEMLTLPDIPDLFKSMKISLKDKVISTEKLEISLDSMPFPMSSNHWLIVNTFYEKTGNQVTWEIKRILINGSITRDNFEIIKYNKPPQSKNIPEDVERIWKVVYNRKYPYNNKPYSREGLNFIGSIKPVNEEQIYGISISLEKKLPRIKFTKVLEAVKGAVIYK